MRYYSEGQFSFNWDDDASSEQAENLERVSARIGRAIIAFFRHRINVGDRTFHMLQLTEWVARSNPAFLTAPDSAGRVMRDLRQRGVISYRLLSRSKSWYEILDVRCKS